MVGHALLLGSGEKLPAGPRGSFEHPDFEEKICDTVHGHLQERAV
jgi:hypothetical protein